ncbi:MAG: hypothetical protein SNG35_01605 [Rikenellaceae bacterium]
MFGSNAKGLLQTFSTEVHFPQIAPSPCHAERSEVSRKINQRKDLARYFAAEVAAKLSAICFTDGNNFATAIDSLLGTNI